MILHGAISRFAVIIAGQTGGTARYADDRASRTSKAKIKGRRSLVTMKVLPLVFQGAQPLPTVAAATAETLNGK